MVVTEDCSLWFLKHDLKALEEVKAWIQKRYNLNNPSHCALCEAREKMLRDMLDELELPLTELRK